MLSNFLNMLWTLGKQHRQHKCFILTDADLDRQAQLRQRQPKNLLAMLQLQHLKLKAKFMEEYRKIEPSEQIILQLWTTLLARAALEYAWHGRDVNLHVLFLQTWRE